MRQKVTKYNVFWSQQGEPEDHHGGIALKLEDGYTIKLYSKNEGHISLWLQMLTSGDAFVDKENKLLILGPTED